MLWADKRALEQRLRVDMIGIRERELDFYSANLQAIGLQAGIFASFLYPAIIYIVIPEGKNDTLITAYLCLTAMAFGLHMLAVVNSMMCAMLAPGLALRGPNGAVHRALDDMLEEYRLTFFLFVLGILAYGLSAVLLCFVIFTWCAAPRAPARAVCVSAACRTARASRCRWLTRRHATASSLACVACARRTVALTTALVAIYFFVLGYFEFARVYSRFKLPPALFITGRFDTDQAAYEVSITAADLRSANAAHAARQTVTQGWQQYLNPAGYSRAYTEAKRGQAVPEDEAGH